MGLNPFFQIHDVIDSLELVYSGISPASSAGIYLLKVSKGNARPMCKICLKLTK